MDKNTREKQNLYEWACRYTDMEGKKYFTDIDANMISYFENPGSEYLQEYGFENVSELKTLIKELWSNEPLFDEIQQTILVAAFKNMLKIEETVKKSDSKEELPTFIYSF